MLESISFTTRIMRKRPLRSLLSILQLALGVWIVAIVLSLSLNAMYEDGAIRSLGDTLLQLQVLKEERSDNHVMTMIISNFQTGTFTLKTKPVHRQCLSMKLCGRSK